MSVGSPLRREAPVRSEPVAASRRNALDRLPGSSHVTQVGLDTATDAEIWTHAGEHGFVIVSKDSDFRQLAFLHGRPPKAIWVRLGNATSIEIFDVLRDGHDEIRRFGDDADEALLVLPRVSIRRRWNSRPLAVG